MSNHEAQVKPGTGSAIDRYYEDYWESPEDYHDPTTPQRQALWRRHLASLPAGAAVLDVGCGDGAFCAFFQSMGYEVRGIDISRRAIDYARRRHTDIAFEVRLIEDEAAEYPAAYDCVFSSEVIEHLFDVGGYLRAINHALKPGGMLVLTTPYHGLIKNLSIDLFNYAGHYDPLGQHIRFFDRKSLGACLTRFGFEPVVWTGYGRPWPLWKSFFVVSRKTREAEE